MANLFDATNAPTGEPVSFKAGDLVQWKRDPGDYSNTAHTLKYALRLAGSAAIEIEITASAGTGSTDFAVSVPSATSAAYTAGDYYWQAYIIRNSDSERVTLDSGIMTVVGNYDASSADPRSHARITLDKIEALIEGRADNSVDNYTIAGRSLVRMGVDELMTWHSHYQALVEAEDNAIARSRGKKTKRAVQVRFV